MRSWMSASAGADRDNLPKKRYLRHNDPGNRGFHYTSYLIYYGLQLMWNECKRDALRL